MIGDVDLSAVAAVAALLLSGWLFLDSWRKSRTATRARINQVELINSYQNAHVVMVDFAVINPSLQPRTIETIEWAASFPWIPDPNPGPSYDVMQDIVNYRPFAEADAPPGFQMPRSKVLDVPVDIPARSSFTAQRPIKLTTRAKITVNPEIVITVKLTDVDGRSVSAQGKIKIPVSKT